MRLQQRAIRVHGMSWPYWHKAVLVIRASRSAVVVSVPKAWRRRAAITWGNSQIVSSLRFAPCPSPPSVWNAYAGGFYLRAATACLPLRFTVGRRSRVVRFGIGRQC